MGGLIVGAIAFLVWSRLSPSAPDAPDSAAGDEPVEADAPRARTEPAPDDGAESPAADRTTGSDPGSL